MTKTKMKAIYQGHRKKMKRSKRSKMTMNK